MGCFQGKAITNHSPANYPYVSRKQTQQIILPEIMKNKDIESDKIALNNQNEVRPPIKQEQIVAIVNRQQPPQISIENIQLCIDYSCQLYKQGQVKKSRQYFEKIFGVLTSISSPTLNQVENLAYVCSNLISLTKAEKQISEKYTSFALEIYSSSQQRFFQELIVLYNNLAILKDEEKDYSKAIQYYQICLGLQQKYFPKNDDRILMTINNIATTYYTIGQRQKGRQMFEKLFKGHCQLTISQNMTLYLSNYKYYQKKQYIFGQNKEAISQKTTGQQYQNEKIHKYIENQDIEEQVPPKVPTDFDQSSTLPHSVRIP